jgi:hypothetical protein
MARNTMWKFGFHVIILMCCRIFLHEGEVGKMRYGTVNSNITVAKPNDFVEGIAMWVQG